MTDYPSFSDAFGFVQRSRAERAALQLTERWVKSDPFYADNPQLSDRERALVQLAIRSYSLPEESERALDELDARHAHGS